MPHSLGCGGNASNCELVRIIHFTDLLPNVIAGSTDTAPLGSARYEPRPRHVYLLFAHEEFVLLYMSFGHEVYILVQVFKLPF